MLSTPRVIFKCPHIKSGGFRAATHLSNYVSYISTREGVEHIGVPARAQRSGSRGERSRSGMSELAPSGGSEGYGACGDEEQLLREFPSSHKLFEYEDFLAAQTQGNASEFITRAIEDNYEAIAKRENYVDYIANRPRVQKLGTHGLFTADGKSGFLTKQGIADIKSMLAKEIFQQDLISIYQRQTQRRDELTEGAEEVMRQLVSEMQSGTLDSQCIGQLMSELAQRLHGRSGKKQYGYLPPALKSLVDEIVTELEKDPRIASAYDLWYREREEVLRTYKDDLPNRIPLSRQKEFKRIKNIIAEEAARLSEAAQVVETDSSGKTDQPRYQPNNSPAQPKVKTPPAGMVFNSVFSLLYHMGRIFQEQRPQPVGGVRVAVDSKLRRKIREKKIAMGHKPDDREEEQRMS